jgi:hypothetical protein
MIGPKLLIATAILAFGVLTACSDTTGPADTQSELRASFASSRQCPSPGTGLAGAENMLHDPTMLTIPMLRDAPQGNIGMFRAIDESAC